MPVAHNEADPLDALAIGGHGALADGALAVITAVEGPSYRPLGAVMAFLAGGARVGTLSSGCIEADLALHAERALAEARPITVRYGRGSPFMDIELPCGGGLEVLVVPRPDRAALDAIRRRRSARRPATLEIDMATGAVRAAEAGETGQSGEAFRIRFLPALQFLIFGKGPEAITFAALARSAGYAAWLYSPDPETLERAAASGAATAPLAAREFPAEAVADPWTAVALFFHDHDWEPAILDGALRTRAFYIGAQGSRRARDRRHAALAEMGVAPAAIARLKGPVGLIPSARNARTLAVSVLAEVLAEAPGAAE